MSLRKTFLLLALLLTLAPAWAQIGQRFPSEKRVVNDPVTGTPLTFLTTQPRGDSKIYPSHPQWTADGQWLVFRSARVKGEAIAVNEASGEMVQVTEGGYEGMLNLARSGGNKLYFLRKAPEPKAMQAIEVDLDHVFADSKAGSMKPAGSYQRVIGTLPAELEAVGDNALDADGQWFYYLIQGKAYAGARLAPGTQIEPPFGPRGMGAGPHAIGKIHVQTGEIMHVVSVPFQIGHIQANLWNPGELVFSWETGGKSPQRTWTVKGDGSGLRPLYPEAPYEWVTHEAVIGKDEVALAIMGHRAIPGVEDPRRAAGTDVGGANPGQDAAWGNSGTREKPTGLAIVNLRTREVNLVGQTPSGSGLWHVHGSPDGRFATGDDFGRSLYLIDRKSREMMVLTTGHKTTARDHIHPTFSPDGRKIQIQSALLSADGREMNICIVPVPKAWLERQP